MISRLLSRRESLFGLFGGLTALTGVGKVRAAGAPGSGLVVLTVGGLVSAPSRGAFDAKRDRFFDHNNLSFTKARAFTLGDLAALPQKQVLVKGDQTGEIPFKGPLMSEVLRTAGPTATAKVARLSALDGYAAELPLGEIEAQGWILATEAGGNAFGIGDFGPLYAARQLAPNERKTEEEGAKWVFSIYYIELAV
jgi:hypothetical protein